jgi:protein-tyrosine phosphatase
MIDIHFHCLPGVDDGPTTWNEAVDLCRAAVTDGITEIVATPHVLRGSWLNEDKAHLQRLTAELNQRLNGMPSVGLGCEFYYSADLIDLWEAPDHGPLIGLNSGSCLLIEFPAHTVPRSAESVVHELVLLGVTPVIAHPERNAVFASEPARLARLIDQGVLTQVTAGSITGDFGRKAYSAVETLYRQGLVHAVASDSHSTTKRPPLMSAARARVRQRWGEQAEWRLFEELPSRIFNSGRRNASDVSVNLPKVQS